MAEQISWTSADGTQTIDLSDEKSGYSVLADGTRGLRSVTYEMATSRYAGLDGTTVDAVRASANEPSLGLIVRAESEAEFRARTRQLIHAMRPQAGEGLLTVRNESGEARTLSCYCVGGLEGDEATNVTMAGSWWRLILKFYAPSPWWQGETRSISFGLGAPVNFFPIFPMTLSPSDIQGMFTVDLSDMDSPTYPQWTVVGPGSSLLLENQTTGRKIQINASLGDGESMLIDTRPGFQTIRRGDGTNLMGSLASDPALWPLIEGVNRVSAQLVGATSASRILGAFRPRYAGI